MDFFSSKKEEVKPTVITPIAKTSKFVDGLAWTLIGAAQDRKEEVRDQMSKSIKDLGDRHPEMVLSSCCNYLQTNTSMSTEHRVTIMNVMKHIIEDNKQSISKPLSLAVIQLGFSEMTASKEVQPEWQSAASALMISLAAGEYGPDVMTLLTKSLDPGVMPHFFIVKTLGDFAVANPLYFVPNCKEIFGRLVALMGMIKHDNLRWVFSAALGHFCEAITLYLVNADEETIRKSGVFATMYSGEVFSAYEMMANQWLNKNESQLRLAIAQAIGHMSETIQRDLFEKELPKIINTYLALYKREKNHLPITQGLSNVLNAAVKDGSRTLDPVLQAMMSQLHALVIASVDFGSHPNVMKNYNELLRCFEITAKVFADHIIAFLLKTFESREEKLRIGTLNIIKHLVNSCDNYLLDKKELLISGLKPMLSETNTKVRKAFAQVVITLASHDYLRLEGGYLMVEFIIRQCSITAEEDAAFQKSKPVPDAVTPAQLRSMSDNVLNLLTTTIPEMENVLWPYLLEMIIPIQYTESLSAVSKCIAFLAAKKREADASDYMIDFDKLVNIPKPHAIISRMLVVLSQPEERPQLGENILNFFKAIGPVLHPSVCDLWDDVVPKMLSYLRDKGGNPQLWVQSKWEDLVLKFLIKTIEEVNDDEWNVQLGEEMCSQFQLYGAYPKYKSMLFKAIGVVLQRSGKKSFVRDKLDYMFNAVDHNKVEDRNGCAVGFGYCASVHLDLVLDKLQNVAQNDMRKKSTGLFGLLSDKSEKDIELIKCTLMLCYGYAAAKADLNLIKSRIEVHVIKNITPFFALARAPIVKEHIIRCVDLLGKTMHPSHLESEFICPQRKELLLAMIKFLITETKGEVTPEVRTLSLQTCATLTLLDPPLPNDEEAEVFTKTLMIYTKLPESELSSIDSIRENFERIVRALFDKTPTVEVLDRFLEYVFGYLSSPSQETRKRAIKFFFAILDNFVDACSPSEDEPAKPLDPNSSPILLKWIASIVPRCTDPEEEIRTCAMECIGKLAEIKGLVSDISDQLVEKITVLSDRIAAAETNAQFAVVHDLARSLTNDISEAELYPFVEVLLKGLSDGQPSSASGTCIILNGIMRLRGAELSAHVSKIVAQMHSAMKGIKNEQTLNGTLHSFRTLATHHLALVATEILGFDVPHDEFVKKSVNVLAKDQKLGDLLMKHCVDLLNNSQPYSETKKGKDYIKEATKPTLHATLTLGEMFEAEEMAETAKAFLPTLFATFLLRIGTTNGIDPNQAFKRNPTEDATKSFQTLLTLIEDENVLAVVKADDFKKRIEGTEFYDAITDLVKAIFQNYEEHIKEMIEIIVPYFSHTFETQRVTVAAIFSALISCCEGRAELLSSLVNALLIRLGDTNLTVKLLILRGLGNVADCGEEEVNRYATTILSALMHGMDDPKNENPEITLEALNGLSKVMTIVNGTNVVAILVNICIKIKPYFETENNEIRAAAFALFGNLHRFGDGPCKAVFYEQIHTNLVTLLVHLNEEDVNIKNVIKKVLTQLGPLFQSDEINDFFQQTLAEDRNVQYGEFMHKMTKLIVAYFSRNLGVYLMDAINFFKSKWAAVRGNAAMFTGYLLGNLPRESRKAINVDHVCNSLISLLKDEEPKVRMKSTEAIGLLFDY